MKLKLLASKVGVIDEFILLSIETITKNYELFNLNKHKWESYYQQFTFLVAGNAF